MLRALGAFVFALWLLTSPVEAQIQPGTSGSSGGGGSGTVTSVSVATANGISGSVANPTTTPAITLTLGAITPSSVAIGAGSAITSSGPGGALASGAFAAAGPCTAFGTAAGTCAQGGVITAGGPTGSATVAPIITYNAAGQLTTVGSATITPAVGSITGLGTGVATALGNTAGGAGGFALVSGANVASVSNSDGSLTISPTTGAVVASLNVGNPNTWTAAQTFNSTFGGTGVATYLASPPAIGGTAPAAGTFTAIIGTAATIEAVNGTSTTSSIQSNVSTSNTGNSNWTLNADIGPVQATLKINYSTSPNTSITNIPYSAVLQTNGANSSGMYIGTNTSGKNVTIYAGGTVVATNAAFTVSGTGQGITVGSATPATGQRGDLSQIKETDAAAAPGAGYAVLKWVAGSAGSCNLIAYAGTSTTPVTIASTVGSGC